MCFFCWVWGVSQGTGKHHACAAFHPGQLKKSKFLELAFFDIVTAHNLGCTVHSVRAVNVVHATQKMQQTKQDDSRMIAVCQTYINIGVQNPETQFSGAVYGAVTVKFLRRRRRKLPCDSHNRKGSVRSWGTIEQLLTRPPHLHVLFHRNYRNVRRTSPREQDKRPASGRRGARVPG